MSALLLGGCGGADAQGEQAVRRMLADPDGARFQNVRREGAFTCGEVNDGRVGYRRFVTEGDVAWIEPVGAAAVPADRSACAKPQSYQSVEERFACDNADRQDETAQRDAAFAGRWARACG